MNIGKGLSSCLALRAFGMNERKVLGLEKIQHLTVLPTLVALYPVGSSGFVTLE